MMPKTAPPSMPAEAEEEEPPPPPAATATIAGGVVMAVTVMATPVTLASIVVALLGALVAVAIVDCTVEAVAVGTRILTSRTTLPAATLTSTFETSTPAVVAIALLTSASTLVVKSETSPWSSRVNSTLLIDGGGGETAARSAGGGATVAVFDCDGAPEGDADGDSALAGGSGSGSGGGGGGGGDAAFAEQAEENDCACSWKISHGGSSRSELNGAGIDEPQSSWRHRSTAVSIVMLSKLPLTVTMSRKLRVPATGMTNIGKSTLADWVAEAVFSIEITRSFAELKDTLRPAAAPPAAAMA